MPPDSKPKPKSKQEPLPKKLNIDGTVNAKTITEINVKELPSIKVENTTDLIAVFSFVITAIIILATTWLTVRSYKKSNDLTERIAEGSKELEATKTRVEILSKNRQGWINTLRDTIADYISFNLSIIKLLKLHAVAEEGYAELEEKKDIEKIIQWNYRVHQAKTESIRLKTKLQLLSNPNEEEFVSLLATIEKLEAKIKDIEKGDVQPTESCSHEIDRVIQASQIILKKEWERVKNIT